jgi:hypothetical protein
MAGVMAGLALREPRTDGPRTARSGDPVTPQEEVRRDEVRPLSADDVMRTTREVHREGVQDVVRRSTEMHVHGTCPSAEGPHCWTAHVVADHSEQGWMRLCNGVILFDDGFFIAPDGHSEPVVLAA